MGGKTVTKVLCPRQAGGFFANCLVEPPGAGGGAAADGADPFQDPFLAGRHRAGLEGLENGPLVALARDPAGLAVDPDQADAARDAEWDRPLALDAEERAAYLGTSAGDRGEALATLQAPDFTLADVEGKLHSLSDYRGQKILLVAYASW